MVNAQVIEGVLRTPVNNASCERYVCALANGFLLMFEETLGLLVQRGPKGRTETIATVCKEVFQNSLSALYT